MKNLYKAAAYAAFIVLTGMLIHATNAFYLEPTFLGFKDAAKDYADMSKIQNAIEACSLDALYLCSFKYSGFAHMINGLLMMLLGVAAQQLFASTHLVISRFIFVAGLVSGLGFLTTGVSDIPGTIYASLLRANNPDFNVTILLISTMIRGIANMVAITGLGFYAAFVGYAVLKSGPFSRWGGWYGFLLLWPGLGGLINPIAGFTYIGIVVPWLIWLGMQFSKIAKE